MGARGPGLRPWDPGIPARRSPIRETVTPTLQYQPKTVILKLSMAQPGQMTDRGQVEPLFLFEVGGGCDTPD